MYGELHSSAEGKQRSGNDAFFTSQDKAFFFRMRDTFLLKVWT